MLRGHTAEVAGLELKGTRIISASADSTLRVYPQNLVALLYVHKGCTHITFPPIPFGCGRYGVSIRRTASKCSADTKNLLVIYKISYVFILIFENTSFACSQNVFSLMKHMWQAVPATAL